MSVGTALREYLTRQRKELFEFYDTPMWWHRQAKQHLWFPIHRLGYLGQGYTHVMDEEWDTLFILDGCRADLFREVADPSGFDSYAEINSGASATQEWVTRQFYGGAYTDTVYVNANPMVSQHIKAAFAQFIDVWRDLSDENGKYRAVPADAVADTVRRVREAHPEKRVIAHFCQPHYPFMRRPELRFDNDDGPSNVWIALRRGLVNHDEVWEGYADNLRYVLDVVAPLAADLEERTVITADHGNLLGERIYPIPMRQWGHPVGLRHPHLTTVPWAVIGGEQTTSEPDDEATREHLRALGYQ